MGPKPLAAGPSGGYLRMGKPVCCEVLSTSIHLALRCRGKEREGYGTLGTTGRGGTRAGSGDREPPPTDALAKTAGLDRVADPLGSRRRTSAHRPLGCLCGPGAAPLLP